MIAEAGDFCFTHRETAAQLTPHAGHLAGKQERRAHGVQETRNHIAPLGARFQDRAADVERLSQCIRHRGSLYKRARHRRGGEARAGAHVDGDMTGEPLEPVHIDDLLEHDDVALVVGDRAWSGMKPIDEEGRHLHFRERAPHAIAVDHRQSRLRRREHRLDRI